MPNANSYIDNAVVLDSIAATRVPLTPQSYSNIAKQTQVSSSPLGQDFIVAASNGLFLNHANPWMVAQTRIAHLETPYKPPYGTAQEFVKIDLPALPEAMKNAVIEHFRRECPLEAAALIAYNWTTKRYALHFPKVISCTGAHITYEYPHMSDSEAIVIDIHSHGVHPAFFSSTDNLDDRGSTKIAVVLGNLDTPTYSAKTRVTVKGVELAQNTFCGILDSLLNF